MMPKNSLFIKIYLIFWLTTIFMIGSMVYMDRITESEPRIEGWRRTAGRTLSFYAGEAVIVFEREGVQALKDFVNRLEESTGIKAYLLDAQGNEVTGRKITPEILNFAVSSRNSADLEVMFSQESHLVSKRITNTGGGIFVFTAEVPKPPMGPPHGPLPGPPPGLANGPPPGPPPVLFHRPPLHFLVRLFVMLLISGLVCYLLALYLTGPIIRLKNAVREFAAGNLNVRVGPTLGRRKDEIASLAHDFDLMAERIENLLIAQRNLMRDVSHELRSPLARLNVAVELCAQRFGPDAEKPLERIRLEAERLNQLIGQILLLNKVESGSPGMEKTRVNLAGLVQDIAADADFEARGQKRVIVSITDPCVIEGNEDVLRRAIGNVVRNALQYTDDHTTVDVTLRRIQTAAGPRALLTVHDHGKGVPEEDLPKLFQPFYRVAEHAKKQKDGSGLGLAITEASVRLHGGSLQARNAPDEGLIVEIMLPLK